jgi:hypothetical protein
MSPWVRLDDHLDDDPRIATVGPAGAGLVILLLVYSNKTLADGFVSDAIARQKAMGLSNADAVFAQLVQVGLLYEAERDGIGGFQIAADIVANQPTRQQVLDAKEAAKERKRRWVEQQQPKRRRRRPAPDAAENGQHATQDAKRRPVDRLTAIEGASPQNGSSPVGRFVS